jgi:hypothetical protein
MLLASTTNTILRLYGRKPPSKAQTIEPPQNETMVKSSILTISIFILFSETEEVACCRKQIGVKLPTSASVLLESVPS